MAKNPNERVYSDVRELLRKIEFTSFDVGVTFADLGQKQALRQGLCDFIESEFGAKKSREPDVHVFADFDRGRARIEICSAYVFGKYNKYSRSIAQTFHFCFKCKGRGCPNCEMTGKLSEESVQELLEKVMVPLFDARSAKFHGCGREDVDVLMLGSGRPFVLELVEPKKRSVGLLVLEKEVNSLYKEKISVHGLEFCHKARVAELKTFAFEKIYGATCSSKNKFDKKLLLALVGKRIDTFQTTPERVEKRRAKKERIKWFEIQKAQVLSPNSFRLEILSSHGLYIKELISGDSERTNPSISSLLGALCECDLLDVLDVSQHKI
ncbi:MAG: tRNA pseudouridine(54/55) synthase Pus10 [archaeon]|nr:tRNA pseudouridine(54/55) synthase Pus10 [archaeon]